MTPRKSTVAINAKNVELTTQHFLNKVQIKIDPTKHLIRLDGGMLSTVNLSTYILF